MVCHIDGSLFFFFKQKTAYEMRISDWSSDVCSSDLAGVAGVAFEHSRQAGAFRTQGIVENLAPHCGGAIIPVSLPLFKPKRPGGVGEPVAGCPEIGRATGRERVCPYV